MKPVKIDPELVSAFPCFSGTQVPIRSLFDWLRAGETMDTFLNEFSAVRPEQVQSVLSFPITIDSEVMGGTPCFAGTRVPIKSLFDCIEHRRTIAEFLAYFPTVLEQQAIRVMELAEDRLLQSIAASATGVVKRVG